MGEIDGPWIEGEGWRIVERQQLTDGNWQLKYIFPDGSHAYTTFHPAYYDREHEELIGTKLAETETLRSFR